MRTVGIIAAALGVALFVGFASLPRREGLAQAPAKVTAEQPAAGEKVYGEWSIRVRPDKGADYDRLIKEKGLPLFREAGGRMVGWWKTLIGDLYEHVTIWEFDGMAGFQKGIDFLGKDERFAKFVAERDPLLAGESSSFLKLAAFAEKPTVPEPAKVVIHEVHRVPLGQRDAYLSYMQTHIAILKRQGFKPVGPFVTAIGNWNEVRFLFCFDSLADRDKLISGFGSQPAGQAYSAGLRGYVDEIRTRLLVPAPFTQ